ncbi:MAG TPA: hydroxymethylglutaryl-CoA reductase, degradative [Anaerolineales bacterium]|nr:hydroxymethylglutaryl-CoA reductase, degradative [Anaerolineales bacterium]
MENTSQISGFYKLSESDRLNLLAQASGLDKTELSAWVDGGLNHENADHMIENVVGLHSLPVGIGLNFLINGKDILIPMVVEEPSIVAGASFMAKLIRQGGGFTAISSPPEMIGQIQVINLKDLESAKKAVLKNKDYLLEIADQVDPVLKKLGGGARGLDVRVFNDTPIGGFLVIHLIYDVRDAMGANAINTACEKLSPYIEQITGGTVRLKILSNLADRRITKVNCRIPLETLAFDEFSGTQVRDGIIAAYSFAEVDPYRAATHNKGIMNGVDAVVIATGNDWRAIEAGAHAYAVKDGKYTSLSRWSVAENGDLLGELEMPMAVGIVGGATKVHSSARAALKLMGVKNAQELAQAIVCVGLAQNLAAIRALATEGIQKGHMGLHARQVAIAAGAAGELVEMVAAKMIADKVIRVDHAENILRSVEENKGKTHG